MQAVRASLGIGDPSDRTRGCLVVLAGLPGSGKSYLAHEVHVASGAVVLRTDEVRRVLFPKPVYTPEESSLVYVTCYATVRALLHENYAVIFDGTNGRRSGRRLFAAIARIAHAEHVSVLVQAPPELVRARIADRSAGHSPAFGSEAGIEIFERMARTENYLGHFDLIVDTGLDIGTPVRTLVNVVAGQRIAVNERVEA